MITLLVPTMNRSEFVIRLLRYYWRLNFRGAIFIGDSSNAEHIERTKKAIEVFRGKLNINYREYPGINNAKCMQQLLDLVTTPYVTFLGDDDFLVPSALEKCTLFLDSHPDYSAAHGVGVGLGLKSPGPSGEVAWVRLYEQPVIESESASQRLLKHMSNYSVSLFSVHRVETWRKMFQDIFPLTDVRFTELQSCCISVIRGKIKELDCFYLVRQSHPQIYGLPAVQDWVASTEWYPSFRIFRDSLTSQLSDQEKINTDKARETIDLAFWTYVANELKRFLRGTYSAPRLMRLAGMIPGARKGWRASRRALRSLNLMARDEIGLDTLLRSSSRYHADFMPIYRAMTEDNQEFLEDIRK